MKKIVLLWLGLLLISTAALALDVNLSANAGAYTAPGGLATSTMYGLSASQDLTNHLSARLSLLSTTYTVGSNTTTYTPIMLDLIYRQPLTCGLTPYAGAGLSYNSTTTTGQGKSETVGAQASAGVRYDFHGFSAGVEYVYIIPDLNDSGTTASSFNAYATSSVSYGFTL